MSKKAKITFLKICLFRNAVLVRTKLISLIRKAKKNEILVERGSEISESNIT